MHTSKIWVASLLVAGTMLALPMAATAQAPAAKKAAKNKVAKPAKPGTNAKAATKAEFTAGGSKLDISMANAGGPKIKVGDLFKGHITVLDPTGKVVNTTRQQPEPIMFRVAQPTFSGDLNQCLTYLAAGDSAMVKVPADSMLKGVPEGQRPPGFPNGSFVGFGVNLMKVVTEADLAKQQREDLLAYAKENKLEVVELPGGLMVSITKPGTGTKIKVNDQASVLYTGKLLNGQVFDSNVSSGQGFSLAVGTGQVIKGWDEGLQQFTEGSKGVLLIPYSMAYGEQGSPPKIPGFAPLIFEIEITKVTAK